MASYSGHLMSKICYALHTIRAMMWHHLLPHFTFLLQLQFHRCACQVRCPDEVCTPGRGSRVAAEVSCLARRKPTGAQGHCEDCGLWACARDPLPAPFHRLCLHQMVSPFLHNHPTSNAQRSQLQAAFHDSKCAADRPPISLLLDCRTLLAAESWGMH